MRLGALAVLLCIGGVALARGNGEPAAVVETVYVEVPTDTDGDGRPDRVYAEVTREAGGVNLPTIFTISPYALGGNDGVANHDVDVSNLPQEESLDGDQSKAAPFKRHFFADNGAHMSPAAAMERGYASVSAHSLGTGRSTGCPTVGDEAETLGAKAVIDWLNGRAKAYSANGAEVFATWANGNVGMIGVSYNGTLPNMVAATGVEGLKAIIPVAAISSWYDYYRANGLVVGPGGYIGEDADVLGKFIVRRGACAAEMSRLTQTMGREHGDFSPFWQARDYVSKADGVRAAVFVVHGQSDWNVRQRHAIQWWEALEGKVPLRMWLHRGGHGNASRADTSTQQWAWFDRYVKGEMNGVDDEPAVEVESPAGQWTAQTTWPHESTIARTFYLNGQHVLSETPAATSTEAFVDNGKTTQLSTLLANPTQTSANRLAFVTDALAAPRLLSGTTKVRLDFAVMNKRAANVTVAVVEYDANGRGRVVTRGWADPQNHADHAQGEPLEPGRRYTVAFTLEPKQYTFARGSRIGIVVAATDYEHTLRPDAGTNLSVTLGRDSFVELHLSN